MPTRWRMEPPLYRLQNLYRRKQSHRQNAHLDIQSRCVLDVRRGRALGNPTPITEDDLWKRIGEDTSPSPIKRWRSISWPRHAVTTITLSTSHSAPSADRDGSNRQDNVGRAVRATVEATAREAFARQRISLEETLQRCATMLKDAAEMIMDHLHGRRPAARATDVPGPFLPPRSAGSPSPPSATSPSPRSLPKQSLPRRRARRLLQACDCGACSSFRKMGYPI